MGPTTKTDRIITSSGIMITGTIDTMKDEIVYDLDFYEEGVKVFSYPYPVDPDPLVHKPIKLRVKELATLSGVLSKYLARQPLEKLLVELGDQYYNWWVDNIEFMEDLHLECEEILNTNEGWDHYAEIRLL